MGGLLDEGCVRTRVWGDIRYIPLCLMMKCRLECVCRECQSLLLSLRWRGPSRTSAPKIKHCRPRPATPSSAAKSKRSLPAASVLFFFFYISGPRDYFRLTRPAPSDLCVAVAERNNTEGETVEGGNLAFNKVEVHDLLPPARRDIPRDDGRHEGSSRTWKIMSQN